jgi:hypothetical protein
MKFMKGDLQYFAVAHPYLNSLINMDEQRSVYEQELIISLAMKQKLFDNLNTSLASMIAIIPHKFIDKTALRWLLILSIKH